MNIPCIAYKSILAALFNFLLLVKTQIVPHFIFQPGIPESQGSTRGLTKAWKEKILWVLVLSVELIPFFVMMWMNTLIHTRFWQKLTAVCWVPCSQVLLENAKWIFHFFLVIYDILWVIYFFTALNLFQTKLNKFSWF